MSEFEPEPQAHVATIETNKVEVEKALKGQMTFVNQYIIIKTLGQGSYGKVKLGLNTNDQNLYAIKIVDKSQLKRKRIAGPGKATALDTVRREIAIMKKLSHANVTNLIEIIDDPDGKHLYMILEYIDGGAVEPPDDGFDESYIRPILRDVCKGLDYLHYHKVVHRDLKPANLLKSSLGVIKVADFGVSQMIELTDKFQNTAGTPAFLAPEMCNSGPYSGVPTDLWALGVTLFNLFYGVVPFAAPTLLGMYDAIRDNELVFPDTKNISDQLKDLISKLLRKNPDERIGLPEVFSHPFTTVNGTMPISSMGSVYPPPDMMQVNDVEITEAVRHTNMASFLETSSVERVYEPGDYLMRKGELGTEMYFIQEGSVEILVSPDPNFTIDEGDEDEDEDDDEEDEDEEDADDVFDMKSLAHAQSNKTLGRARSGSRRSKTDRELDSLLEVVAIRGQGEFVGEMALISVRSVRSAFVRAQTKVTVLVITAAQLKDIMQNEPEAKDQLMATISQRQTESIVHRTSEMLRQMDHSHVVRVQKRGSFDLDKSGALFDMMERQSSLRDSHRSPQHGGSKYKPMQGSAHASSHNDSVPRSLLTATAEKHGVDPLLVQPRTFSNESEAPGYASGANSRTMSYEVSSQVASRRGSQREEESSTKGVLSAGHNRLSPFRDALGGRCVTTSMPASALLESESSLIQKSPRPQASVA
mmetsp:Transcript_2849/g.5351  ORF Transcript_2849/g.5351 Transcript_2849/m.5351 type:complete len:701 (-) Transcript_2849:72-2174(-)